jgi:hypothetical protein
MQQIMSVQAWSGNNSRQQLTMLSQPMQRTSKQPSAIKLRMQAMRGNTDTQSAAWRAEGVSELSTANVGRLR